MGLHWDSEIYMIHASYKLQNIINFKISHCYIQSVIIQNVKEFS